MEVNLQCIDVKSLHKNTHRNRDFICMSSKVSFLFLTVIIMMGSVALFATDIYLPALPEMAQYFNCTQSEIQASFTVFLLGLAGCQLTYGVLCDRFGRKRVTLFGLALFMVGSVLCALSTTLTEFMLARILQAIGGGVGSVVGRAIIATRYTRAEAVKVFSTTFPIIGLSAAIGPLVGGYLTFYFSWKANFYFMVLYGAIALLLVSLCLKETEPEKALSTNNLTFTESLSAYTGVLRNVNFLGYALILCAGYSAFRCYAVESPFVFDSHGYVAEEMGAFYVALSIAYLIGNLLAKKLVNSMTVERVLTIGFWFFVLGGLSMMAGSFYVDKTPYTLILPMALVTLGNGFLFPTGSAGAMASVSGQFSGMASGLLGSMQFILAAACINWVGELCHGHALSMSIFISVIIFSGLCSFLLLVFRRSDEDVAIS